MAENKLKFKAAEAQKGHGPGGHHGGFQKPKDAKKTIRRLLSYLTQKKFLLLIIGLCLILSTAVPS